MRVRSLTMQRYGAFTDRGLEFGPGLSLVVGVNEAGKSTALEGLSDLLWGIPAGSRQAFLHGRQSLALRALLELDDVQRLEVVRRSIGLTDVVDGSDVVGAWQTPSDSRHRWRESFGMSHTQLREGGQQLCQGGGDLAELVFTARSGRLIRELLADVQRTADTLYKEHRGNRSVAVRVAYAEYEQVRDRVDAATAGAAQVQAVREAVEQAAGDVQHAEKRLKAARAAETGASQRRRAAPHAQQLATVRAQQASIRAAGSVLNKAQLSEHEQAQEELAAAEQALASPTDEFTGVTAARAELVVDAGILAAGADIRRLQLEAQARLADARQADELSEQAATHSREAASLLTGLVGPSGRTVPELLAALHVPADRTTQLDETAEQLHRAAEVLAVKEEALEGARRRMREDLEPQVAIAPDAVAAVREACAAIRAEGSAASAHRTAAHARADALRRREEALRLAGLPVGAAVPATMPSATAIREATGSLDAAHQELRDAQQRTQREESALQQTQQALAALDGQDVPDEDQLQETRGLRDAAIAELIASWLNGRPQDQAPGLPLRVERAVADADIVADNLRDHAQEAARRDELAATLGRQRAARDAALEDLTTRTQQAEAARRDWLALWAELGSAVPDPADALEVRRLLHEARVADEEATAAERHLAALQEQIRSQTTALAAALSAAGRPRPGFDLDALLETATAFLDEDDAARESRAQREQLARLEADAQRDRDTAATTHNSIQTRWHTLLRSSNLPDDLDGPAWHRRRDLLVQAGQRHQQAEGLLRDAEQARGRYVRWADAVAALAHRHALQDHDPATAIDVLAERLEKAGLARETAEQLDRRIAELTAKIGKEEDRRLHAQKWLETQRVAVDVPTLDDLDLAAERSRSLARSTQVAEQLEGLLRAAAPDADLDLLVAELATAEPEILQAACTSAEEQLAAAEEALKQALAGQAQVGQRERALTTGQGAAELHAHAQESLATAGELVERYLVARIQAEVLRHELEVYERKHASPLLDEAGTLLERLTGGRYVALGVRDVPGGRSLEIVGADEERHTPAELSEGTADQVYLALRLAGIASLQQERQAAGVPTLPVVLDDVLMTFDDIRTTAALQVMAELAENWQIIIFSHHTHLAGLAVPTPLSLTVSRLGPPPLMATPHAAAEIRARARSTFPAPAAAPLRTAAAKAPAPRPSRPSPDRAVEPGAVREWARAQGYPVGERGRIPADVTAAYLRAHSS